MKLFQSLYQNGQWEPPLPEANDAQLLLTFGSPKSMAEDACQASLQEVFPKADIIGCSTSGEILGTQLYDDTLAMTAVTWSKTETQVVSTNVERYKDSYEAAMDLAKKLPQENLRHVLVLSDGHTVNGTLMVNGLHEALPKSVSVTGGLAGDGERFEKTWAWHNDTIEPGLIVLCGFYGDSIKLHHGCVGGWDAFGPDRLITKAKDNVLYELDGKSALELYKEYLGEHAKDLPGSALLFPLHVHREDEERGVVRTILNLDEDEQSMTFAGNIEEGAYAQLMHASFDDIIDAAGDAAEQARPAEVNNSPCLAVLVSCVGRRIVLKTRVEEELESVKDALPESASLCGFYSYGEVSPLLSGSDCTLHNQTMTITTFTED